MDNLKRLNATPTCSPLPATPEQRPAHVSAEPEMRSAHTRARLPWPPGRSHRSSTNMPPEADIVTEEGTGTFFPSPSPNFFQLLCQITWNMFPHCAGLLTVHSHLFWRVIFCHSWRERMFFSSFSDRINTAWSCCSITEYKTREDAGADFFTSLLLKQTGC